MTIQDKKAKKAAIVADWQASGMSQMEYAQLHNLKIGTLRYWVARQRRMSEKAGAFIHLTVSLRPRASCVVDRFWPTCGQKIL